MTTKELIHARILELRILISTESSKRVKKNLEYLRDLNEEILEFLKGDLEPWKRPKLFYRYSF